MNTYQADLHSSAVWEQCDPHVSFEEGGQHIKCALLQSPTFCLFMLGSVLDTLISFLQTIYFLFRLNVSETRRYFKETLKCLAAICALLVFTVLATPMALWCLGLHILGDVLFPLIKQFKPNYQTGRERLEKERALLEKGRETLQVLLNAYDAMRLTLDEDSDSSQQTEAAFSRLKQDCTDLQKEWEVIRLHLESKPDDDAELAYLIKYNNLIKTRSYRNMASQVFQETLNLNTSTRMPKDFSDLSIDEQINTMLLLNDRFAYQLNILMVNRISCLEKGFADLIVSQKDLQQFKVDFRR